MRWIWHLIRNLTISIILSIIIGAVASYILVSIFKLNIIIVISIIIGTPIIGSTLSMISTSIFSKKKEHKEHIEDIVNVIKKTSFKDALFKNGIRKNVRSFYIINDHHPHFVQKSYGKWHYRSSDISSDEILTQYHRLNTHLMTTWFGEYPKIASKWKELSDNVDSFEKESEERWNNFKDLSIRKFVSEFSESETFFFEEQIPGKIRYYSDWIMKMAWSYLYYTKFSSTLIVNDEIIVRRDDGTNKGYMHRYHLSFENSSIPENNGHYLLDIPSQYPYQIEENDVKRAFLAIIHDERMNSIIDLFFKDYMELSHQNKSFSLVMNEIIDLMDDKIDLSGHCEKCGFTIKKKRIIDGIFER